MKSQREVEDRIAQHERDLNAWREEGRRGLTSLVPTEPDPEERERVRLGLEAAIFVLKWVVAP